MIGLHIYLQHFYVFLLAAQAIDLLPDILPYLATEDPKAIFGAEHDMILAFIQAMR
jgi:hypothetical protein